MPNVASSLVPQTAECLNYESFLASNYLCCVAGDACVALPALNVQDLVSTNAIILIPETPTCVPGVLQWRGRVIPVIDLGLQLGLAAARPSAGSCIVIVTAELPTGIQTTMGLLVDGVLAVTRVEPEDLLDGPTFGPSIQAECVRGAAWIRGMACYLLDPGRTLAL